MYYIRDFKINNPFNCYSLLSLFLFSIISELVEATVLEKQDDARDETVEAVFLSILRHKDLDMRDKKAAIVDFIAAGIHTVRKPLCINYSWLARIWLLDIIIHDCRQNSIFKFYK